MTIMTNEFNMGHTAVLAQLGRSLAERRISMGLTQAELAKQSGISKRTVERIEAGNSCQTSALIRVLRVLELQEDLLRLIPPASPHPMDLLKTKRKERKRASSKIRTKNPAKKWTWGDEQ